MMIDATPRNVEWLIERLYNETREFQSRGILEPVFVLLTRTAAERHRAEQVVWRYFGEKYGQEMFRHVDCESSGQSASSFHFPGLSCRVMLMDLSNSNPKVVCQVDCEGNDQNPKPA